MSKTALGAVTTEPETVEVQEFALPEIGADEALLKMELGGVCGSDPKAYKGEHLPESLPTILGHEILGRIERIGDEAKREHGVEEGDRVVVEARRRCGSCQYCLDGRYQFCEAGGTYGYTSITEPPSLWGAHAEYLYLAPNTVLHPIDDAVPAEAGVLACAVVGNSIRWLQAGSDEFVGRSLVIQGSGPQGLSMTIVADKLGLTPIVVTGVPGDERRLALAEQLGADYTVCREPDELVEATKNTLGGHAEIVANLTASANTVQQSIDMVGIGGTVVYPNVVEDSDYSTVQLNPLVNKEAKLVGVLSRTAKYVDRAITLIENDPEPFTKLVSHTYPVEKAETAYHVAGGMTDESPLKVAIDPNK